MAGATLPQKAFTTVAVAHGARYGGPGDLCPGARCDLCRQNPGTVGGNDCPPSAERRKPAPRRACLTWEKYSSEMRAAHSMLCSSGRQGLDTSAHLISMRLIRVRFSGVLSTVFMAACSLSVS